LHKKLRHINLLVMEPIAKLLLISQGEGPHPLGWILPGNRWPAKDHRLIGFSPSRELSWNGAQSQCHNQNPWPGQPKVLNYEWNLDRQRAVVVSRKESR